MKSSLARLNFTGKMLINLSAAAAVGFMVYVYETDYRQGYTPQQIRAMDRLTGKVMGDASTANRQAAERAAETLKRPTISSPATFRQRQAAALQEIYGIKDSEIGKPVRLFSNNN